MVMISQKERIVLSNINPRKCIELMINGNRLRSMSLFSSNVHQMSEHHKGTASRYGISFFRFSLTGSASKAIQKRQEF